MRISDWSSDVCSSDLGLEGARRIGVKIDSRVQGIARAKTADDRGGVGAAVLPPRAAAQADLAFLHDVLDPDAGREDQAVGDIEVRGRISGERGRAQLRLLVGRSGPRVGRGPLAADVRELLVVRPETQGDRKSGV